MGAEAGAPSWSRTDLYCRLQPSYVATCRGHGSGRPSRPPTVLPRRHPAAVARRRNRRQSRLGLGQPSSRLIERLRIRGGELRRPGRREGRGGRNGSVCVIGHPHPPGPRGVVPADLQAPCQAPAGCRCASSAATTRCTATRSRCRRSRRGGAKTVGAMRTKVLRKMARMALSGKGELGSYPRHFGGAQCPLVFARTICGQIRCCQPVPSPPRGSPPSLFGTAPVVPQGKAVEAPVQPRHGHRTCVIRPTSTYRSPSIATVPAPPGAC